MGKHFRHEILAELAAIVSQPVGMLRIARKEQQPKALESVGVQDHRPCFLEAAPALGIQIFRTVRSAVLVGPDPDHPAMSPQIKIAGRQRFRNRSEGRIPFVAVKRAEPIAPGAVGGGRATAIRDRIDSGGDRVRVQTDSFGGFRYNSPRRNGRIAGIGKGLLRLMNGLDSSPAIPISCSRRV